MVEARGCTVLVEIDIDGVHLRGIEAELECHWSDCSAETSAYENHFDSGLAPFCDFFCRTGRKRRAVRIAEQPHLALFRSDQVHPVAVKVLERKLATHCHAGGICDLRRNLLVAECCKPVDAFDSTQRRI